MFDYKSTTELESKIQPGVKFTLNTPNNELQDAIIDASADIRSATTAVLVEAEDLEGKEDSESKKRLSELYYLATRNRRATSRMYFKLCIKSIDGMLIDGEIPNGETFYFKANSELVNEVDAVIKGYLGLTVEEQKN